MRKEWWAFSLFSLIFLFIYLLSLRNNNDLLRLVGLVLDLILITQPTLIRVSILCHWRVERNVRVIQIRGVEWGFTLMSLNFNNICDFVFIFSIINHSLSLNYFNHVLIIFRAIIYLSLFFIKIIKLNNIIQVLTLSLKPEQMICLNISPTYINSLWHVTFCGIIFPRNLWSW